MHFIEFYSTQTISLVSRKYFHRSIKLVPVYTVLRVKGRKLYKNRIIVVLDAGLYLDTRFNWVNINTIRSYSPF